MSIRPEWVNSTKDSEGVDRPNGSLHSTGVKRFAVLLSLGCLLAVLGACFDYEERVFFQADWSGRVRVRYVVPINAGSGRSLIRFLPVEKPRIEERYGRRVENYEVRLLERPADLRGLRNAAEVSFELAFRRPADLERILLGTVHVRRRPGRVAIERTFPVRPPADAKIDRIEKKIRDTTLRTMENHYLHFYLEFPKGFTLHSNRGVLLRPGNHLFTLPLSDTLDRPEKHTWNMELKVDQDPADEPGNAPIPVDRDS